MNKPPRSVNSTLKRSEFGAAKKGRVMSEQAQARALEGTAKERGLFQLFPIDWMHIADSRRCTGSLRRGCPDYLIVGDGWKSWLEIKARNLETGRLGRKDSFQDTFHAKLTAAGDEVWTAYLPDDMKKLAAWLEAKTGVKVEVQL